MKLTIFNGSPRGKNSNSSFIIQWLTEGLKDSSPIEHESFYLNNVQKHNEYVQNLIESDYAIIVFPLYTDCMPGLVMAFFEMLEQVRKPLSGLKLGFIIHSGFPEACHSRYMERYAVNLTKELGAEYIGTVIMPSSEGTRVMPEAMNKTRRSLFRQLGEKLIAIGSFDEDILIKIAGKEKMSELSLAVFKLLSKTGLTNFHWNSQMKSNNAYEHNFDRPYTG